MTDQFDIASDREQEERDYRIDEARRNRPPEPVLGCEDCSFMPQDVARVKCEHFPVCLRDWEMAQAAKRRNGSDQ